MASGGTTKPGALRLKAAGADATAAIMFESDSREGGLELAQSIAIGSSKQVFKRAIDSIRVIGAYRQVIGLVIDVLADKTNSAIGQNKLNAARMLTRITSRLMGCIDDRLVESPVGNRDNG